MKNEGPVERRSNADADDTSPTEPIPQRHAPRNGLQAHIAHLEMRNKELREAQVRAEAAHQVYMDLYEDSPVAHLVLDKDGVILRASRAAGDLLDTPVRRLLHKPFHLFVQRETLNEYRVHCREAILTRQRVSCGVLLRIRDRNPVEARIEIAGVRYPEADGLVCHMAIVEIRELEEAETAELPRDVPAMNPAASQDARPLWIEPAHEDGHAIHEIRNAVACVKNILTLLASAVPGEHPYARYIPVAEDKLNDIASAVERLSRMPSDEPDEAPVFPIHNS